MEPGYTRLALQRINLSVIDGELHCLPRAARVRRIERLPKPIGKFTHLLRCDGMTVALSTDEARAIQPAIAEYPPQQRQRAPKGPQERPKRRRS